MLEQKKKKHILIYQFDQIFKSKYQILLKKRKYYKERDYIFNTN